MYSALRIQFPPLLRGVGQLSSRANREKRRGRGEGKEGGRDWQTPSGAPRCRRQRGEKEEESKAKFARCTFASAGVFPPSFGFLGVCGFASTRFLPSSFSFLPPSMPAACVRCPPPSFRLFSSHFGGSNFCRANYGNRSLRPPARAPGEAGKRKTKWRGHSVGFPLPFVSAELHTAFKTWCWSAYVGGYLEMVDQFP